MKISSFISALIISSVSLISLDLIKPKTINAQPNCQCNNNWCYVFSQGNWQPVNEGAMISGFAYVCQNAWNQYRNSNSNSSRGLSRSCFNQFSSCMDRCDRLHYSQVSYCISSCQSIRRYCQSNKPSYINGKLIFHSNCDDNEFKITENIY